MKKADFAPSPELQGKFTVADWVESPFHHVHSFGPVDLRSISLQMAERLVALGSPLLVAVAEKVEKVAKTTTTPAA